MAGAVLKYIDDVADLIKEKGYDIKENAQKLEKKYKELIQQYKIKTSTS